MSIYPVNLKLEIKHGTISENYLCEEAQLIIKAVRPNWFNVGNGPLRAKALKGGISNLLFAYYIDGKFDEDVVLIRIHGVGTSMMIDREEEKTNIQALSAAGRCPPMYATFLNGIAYGYVHGVMVDKLMVRDEAIRKLIIREIIEVQKVRPGVQRKGSKLFDHLYTWLELVPESFPDDDRNNRLKANVRSKFELRQEIDELRSYLEPLNSPIVFCHNDLLLDNIIFNVDKGSVQFIDHEYSMYNYEHYDLANHLSEYRGVLDGDTERYPNKEFQIPWLRYYLEQKALDAGQPVGSVTDKEVEECFVKVNMFALAARMHWGLWGLVQAKYSVLDFNFLDYGSRILDEYFARKEECLTLKLPS